MWIEAASSQKIFEALGAQLATLTDEVIEIVVCGGAALQALRLVGRSTADVDVLAVVHLDRDGTLTLMKIDSMPPALAEAARRIQRDFNLADDWFNAGPTSQVEAGLPEGFVSRLHRHEFGPRLVVHFIDRYDQIFFKMFAIVDNESARHIRDLQALQPSQEEMQEASRWVLTQDEGAQFPTLVQAVLRKLGFPDVADTL